MQDAADGPWNPVGCTWIHEESLTFGEVLKEAAARIAKSANIGSAWKYGKRL